jgi:hypothetical protein
MEEMEMITKHLFENLNGRDHQETLVHMDNIKMNPKIVGCHGAGCINLAHNVVFVNMVTNISIKGEEFLG